MALGNLHTRYPALTRGANVWRAYGACGTVGSVASLLIHLAPGEPRDCKCQDRENKGQGDIQPTPHSLSDGETSLSVEGMEGCL